MLNLQNLDQKWQENKKDKPLTFLPDVNLSLFERRLIIEFEEFCISKGYSYLSIPSIVPKTCYQKQGTVDPEKVFGFGDYRLTGSAEQRILESFSNQTILSNLKIVSTNQCFRNELEYVELLRLAEFKKVEQFGFLTSSTAALITFDEFLNNSIAFLKKYKIEYRVIDETETDQGYHHKKYDIQIKTNLFGWIETHSRSYFEKEQTKRFNISGAEYTVSCTGIASPRILIPFLEKNKTLKWKHQ